MKTPTLVATLLALVVASGIARQAPTQQPPQGQTGGRQGRGGAQGQRGGAQGGAQDAQPRDTTPATPATSSITGRVVTADSGKPVKRAQVRIFGTGRGGRSTITDDQGVYTVTALS